MKKVTDKDLLAQLNGMGDDDLQSPLHHVKKLAEPSSALGTFGKSAFRAAPEAIGNLMMKMGLTTPEIMEEALNGKRNGKILHDEAYEQGKEMHPIANILVNMEYGIWNMEYLIWNMEYGIWNMEYGIWNMEYGI